jgi:hypothetical protein
LKPGLVRDNLVERPALLSGVFPRSIFECWFGIMLARTIMTATELDVFENFAAGPLTAEEVARRCGTSTCGGIAFAGCSIVAGAS